MGSQLQEKMVVDVGTWEQTFQELIKEVKPRARWTLKLDKNIQPDYVAQGWKQYQQRAFGRFRCSSCRRIWASAQVQILCHMYWESRKSQGQVLMRLFDQRCQKCSRPQFEKPEFSADSTMRILSNLVQRIQEKYYTDGIRKFREMPVILEMPLEGSHDMANCEACTLGFCVQSLQNYVTDPSKSPRCYMEIGSPSPHIGDKCSQKQARKQSAEAKEAQRSGYHCGHNRSGPSHATARTQVPGVGSQPKRETGRQHTPGADQQAARETGLQPIQVARSLPPGWTDPQPTRAIGPLPAGWLDSQYTLGTRPQVPQRTYSQVIRWASQQSTREAYSQATRGAGQPSTQEVCSQATRGAGQQSTREVCSQATRAAGQQSTREVSSQATRGAGQPSTQEVCSQATRGAGQLSTREVCSQATLGAGQMLTRETCSQATQAAGQQSTQEVCSQATRETGQLLTRETCSQATQGAGQQVTQETCSQATRGAGQPSTQETCSQATRVAGQQSPREVFTCSQATRGAGLQATRGTDLQPTQRADPTATHGSVNFNGTQAAWRRQDRHLPRGPTPDSFRRPSSSLDSFRQDNLFMWGFVCVAVLWTFLVSKYLK